MENGGGGGKCLLARWTTDFDFGFETDWWYVIKDTPFDINSLKAKRRYEINKGLKNFEIRVIDSKEFVEELLDIRVGVVETYSKSYRGEINKDLWRKEVSLFSKNYTVFGAFYRETGQLCGYANVLINGKCFELIEVKVIKEFERYSVNAAIVYQILENNKDFLNEGYIICDGERNVRHKTSYQDYLEKYFGFRKAFCRLHLKYNPKIAWMIPILYFFRKIFLALDGIKFVHNLNAVLFMEEIVRKQKKNKHFSLDSDLQTNIKN